MNPFKLIDILCRITSIQADIIRKQQAVIMQHGIEIADETMDQQIEEASGMLDQAEMDLRKI